MRISLVPLLALWVCGAGLVSAQAAVTAVSAAPVAARVGLGSGASFSVNWNVTTSAAGAVTLSSARGELRTPAGALLATVGQPLSRAASGPAAVAFSETVFVPADAIHRAHKEGFDRLLYQRSFTDGVAASGQVTLAIVTQRAADFGLSRLQLGFDDGRPLRIAARGDKLKAQAEIGYAGGGILKGAWEIAGPNPDADKPAWRALANVTEALTGADTAILASPLLPTDIGGPYLVRLRVDEPAARFDLAPIRYVVGEKQP